MIKIAPCHLLKRQKITKLVILGAAKAGKTTLVRYLETNQPVMKAPEPTLGIDYRAKPVTVNGWKISIIDVGGQTVFQEIYWKLGLNQVDGVIYIIDGILKPDVHTDRFEVSLSAFDYMLELFPPAKPILVFINKQDLIDKLPLSMDQAGELYPFQRLKQYPVTILPSSAKFGTGVKEGMQWIIDILTSNN